MKADVKNSFLFFRFLEVFFASQNYLKCLSKPLPLSLTPLTLLPPVKKRAGFMIRIRINLSCLSICAYFSPYRCTVYITSVFKDKIH
jgi:hypothetical protein